MDSEKTDNISKDFYELCYRQYEFEMKKFTRFITGQFRFWFYYPSFNGYI